MTDKRVSMYNSSKMLKSSPFKYLSCIAKQIVKKKLKIVDGLQISLNLNVKT